MGQKLLAYLFYGFLVLMVIAALFLLKYQLEQKNIKQQQIDSRANVVSRVTTETTEQNTKQKSAPKKTTQSTAISPANSQPDPESTQSSLTYLAVYRQWQNAQACKPFFQHWQQFGIQADPTDMVRPAQKFYGMPDYLPNEKQPLVGAQRTTLNHWQKICHELVRDYGIFTDDNTANATLTNNIADSIEHLLLNKSPKTAKEQALHSTRNIAALWQNSFNHLERVLAGTNSLSADEIISIEDELDQLSRRKGALNAQFSNDLSDDEVDAIFTELASISDHETALAEQLNDQKLIDKEALTQAVNTFQSHDQKLNQSLHSRDADVFFEALHTIEGLYSYDLTILGFSRYRYNKADSYRITPDQMVLAYSEWQNSHLQDDALRYATHLYLCDLGWDCSSNSALMMQYCLRHYYTYPDACGVDVTRFYQQYLISTNRMIDVLNFKAILQDLYHD
ncbi:MAG: hypothetical protein DWP95_09785 [Proteobacteria bacterium]|nr:MAG: hypothetical protein DWP95_09785 [Pseudomonadota bacterium]